MDLIKNQFIFKDKKEIKRLHIQNRLLSEYEEPIFDHLLAGKCGVSVLDIGSNDGMKTKERFSRDEVSKVIGLEYNAELARKAQKVYGNEKFSFYPFDVEEMGFPEKLRSLMEEKKIEGFDVIYLSLVLMHLSDMKKIIVQIYPFLKDDGHIVIVEANDENSVLSPDKEGLLAEYLDILKKDKYSGNREAGKIVGELLEDIGYENIHVWCESISAGAGEKEKKKDIFITFFSYLPEDVEILLEEEPEQEDYLAWAEWINCNYKKLRHLIVQESSAVFMGLRMISCTKGKK